jgi:hypothetical protein
LAVFLADFLPFFMAGFFFVAFRFVAFRAAFFRGRETAFGLSAGVSSIAGVGSQAGVGATGSGSGAIGEGSIHPAPDQPSSSFRSAIVAPWKSFRILVDNKLHNLVGCASLRRGNPGFPFTADLAPVLNALFCIILPAFSLPASERPQPCPASGGSPLP